MEHSTNSAIKKSFIRPLDIFEASKNSHAKIVEENFKKMDKSAIHKSEQNPVPGNFLFPIHHLF